MPDRAEPSAATATEPPATLPASYFDGRSAAAHPVELLLRDGRLMLRGAGIGLDYDAARLSWPEHQRHGPRLLLLPDGGQIHCADGTAWDRWAARHGQRRSLVVRLQQSWRATLAACVTLVLLGWLLVAEGLPLLSSAVLLALPQNADRAVGHAAFEQIDEAWFAPSALPAARQQQLRNRLDDALRRQTLRTGVVAPDWQLQFRRSRDARGPGPNALALPGGTIIVTDELVELLHDREDVLLGVLAHEMGHLRQRHGMRMVVQGSLLGIVTGLLFNDIGSVIAGAPLLLGQMAYSRDFERQADDEAIDLLRANGIAPDVLVLLFERLAAQRNATAEPYHPSGAWEIAFASHPPDAERIARLRAASGT